MTYFFMSDRSVRLRGMWPQFYVMESVDLVEDEARLHRKYTVREAVRIFRVFFFFFIILTLLD